MTENTLYPNEAYVTRTDGALVTTYCVSCAPCQTDDGRWGVWADMTARTLGGREMPVGGGIHIRRATRASLLNVLRSGAI